MSQEIIPQSPSLSSVPINITAHVDLLSNVQTRLDTYQSKARDVWDNTIPILCSLVKFLPREGIYNVCEGILSCGLDEELHTLAQHFLAALLAPCKPSAAVNQEQLLSSNSQISETDTKHHSLATVRCSRRHGRGF